MWARRGPSLAAGRRRRFFLFRQHRHRIADSAPLLPPSDRCAQLIEEALAAQLSRALQDAVDSRKAELEGLLLPARRVTRSSAARESALGVTAATACAARPHPASSSHPASLSQRLTGQVPPPFPFLQRR